MSGQLLLCTDLDRTVLPNGPQPESPGVLEGVIHYHPGLRHWLTGTTDPVQANG